MNSKKVPILVAAGVVAAAVIGWLAFGFFGIQAAFIDNEVSESADDLFDTPTTEVVLEESDAEPVEVEEVEVVETTPAQEPTEEPAEAEETQVEEPAEAEEPEVEEPAEQEPEPEEPVNEIVTALSGTFTGLSDYAVGGDAIVLSNGTDQRFLRFENFAADNGPDLKVYLRAENGDFVSLGGLSGNIGDQNYEIPVGVDLDIFNTVEIWCERFSVGFGSATLS